jgi:hypothetical protein
MNSVPKLLLLAATLTSAQSASAQEDRRDLQSWTNLSFIAPVGKSTEVKIDGLVQITDDLSHSGRELVRAVIRTKISDKVMLGGGYAWTHVAPGDAPSFVEHRAVQQLDVTLPLGTRGATIASRTQIEERFRGGEDGMSLRLRQSSRVQVPIAAGGVSVVGWNEYFHELRKTRWAGGSGPSLMLNFAGVRIPLSRHVSIEPGYINQTNFDPGRNRVAHIAALYVTLRP